MTSETLAGLNDDQLRAVHLAIETAQEAGHMALIGPAGTGKTTVIRATAHELARIYRDKSVLLLAPTHKARHQFSAAALPYGCNTWTVARFCRVKPRQWRDEDRFSLSAEDLKTVQYLQRNVSFVIVDESSMVTHELAAAIVDIAREAGVGVMFAGDPYQLPPVQERLPLDEFSDLADDDGPEGVQAPEFVAAPAIARLTKVMRHGGPILDYATALRANWSATHSFPGGSIADDLSEIRLVDDPKKDFIARFEQVYELYKNDLTTLYAFAPRALCHQNRTVNLLTGSLREAIYGRAAVRAWQQGEIIMFPRYTKTDGGFIHSSSDAVVVEAGEQDLPPMAITIAYTTQARQLDKTLELLFSGKFQRLTVRPVRPDGTVDEWREHVVFTPFCDDPEPWRMYREAREKVQARRLPATHEAWQWLKTIKEKYLTPISSAFVMTVHKSQGSTFEHVYVSRDLLYVSERETLNSLLYVAATRASKSITFGSANGNGS